jgi:hypothetical protein
VNNITITTNRCHVNLKLMRRSFNLFIFEEISMFFVLRLWLCTIRQVNGHVLCTRQVLLAIHSSRSKTVDKTRCDVDGTPTPLDASMTRLLFFKDAARAKRSAEVIDRRGRGHCGTGFKAPVRDGRRRRGKNHYLIFASQNVDGAATCKVVDGLRQEHMFN